MRSCMSAQAQQHSTLLTAASQVHNKSITWCKVHHHTTAGHTPCTVRATNPRTCQMPTSICTIRTCICVVDHPRPVGLLCFDVQASEEGLLHLAHIGQPLPAQLWGDDGVGGVQQAPCLKRILALSSGAHIHIKPGGKQQNILVWEWK